MKIGTKYFGNIEIGEEKIIHFENGVLGFEDYKDYTILYDNEKEKVYNKTMEFINALSYKRNISLKELQNKKK